VKQPAPGQLLKKIQETAGHRVDRVAASQLRHPYRATNRTADVAAKMAPVPPGDWQNGMAVAAHINRHVLQAVEKRSSYSAHGAAALGAFFHHGFYIAICATGTRQATI
jgi:hypothetical protein